MTPRGARPDGPGPRTGAGTRSLVAAVVAVLGVAAFVSGGADDSPGLQLVGAALVVTAALLLVRARRRARDR